MHRLFVSRAALDGPRLRIAGPALRHLRALRLGAGEHFLVFDEDGLEHEARLERQGGRVAEAVVLATRRPARESSLDLVLAVALLKGAKMDLVIEKATELGVHRIVPVLCRRVIAPTARRDRWQRLALAAATQCGRTSVPVVEAATTLTELVRASWPGLRLIAWEGEAEQPLAALPERSTGVVVVVGPEGGFADDEVAEARAHGFTAVTLAPRILRAETAAITAVALCQHRWGDLSSAAAVR